jgi:hypothetical protein
MPKNIPNWGFLILDFFKKIGCKKPWWVLLRHLLVYHNQKNFKSKNALCSMLCNTLWPRRSRNNRALNLSARGANYFRNAPGTFCCQEGLGISYFRVSGSPQFMAIMAKTTQSCHPIIPKQLWNMSIELLIYFLNYHFEKWNILQDSIFSLKKHFFPQIFLCKNFNVCENNIISVEENVNVQWYMWVSWPSYSSPSVNYLFFIWLPHQVTCTTHIPSNLASNGFLGFWFFFGGASKFLHFGNGEEKEIFFSVNWGGGKPKNLKNLPNFWKPKIGKKI